MVAAWMHVSTEWTLQSWTYLVIDAIQHTTEFLRVALQHSLHQQQR